MKSASIFESNLVHNLKLEVNVFSSLVRYLRESFSFVSFNSRLSNFLILLFSKLVMPFRTAPGTYTNTPLGKELSKTQRLQKESYPVARTTRATPILGDFGPVNYERFTRDANSTIVIILIIVIIACLVFYFMKKNNSKSIEETPLSERNSGSPLMPNEVNRNTDFDNIEYPTLEGGAARRKHRTHKKHDYDLAHECPCGDDIDDIYQMKANGMMI